VAAPALDLVDLTKVYAGPDGVKALDRFSLQVQPGEIFGLLGPNGAGKTTTVGICTTRVRATAGRALVQGFDVARDSADVKRRIGVVTQQNTLDRSCTIRENLVYHCRYFGMGSRASTQRADELLERFKLTDRAAALPMALSGGLAQRVQIARAIAHRPGILFLDEPTAGLDPQSRLALWELVADLRRDGLTVLLTTHYMEEADRLSDRLAILDHGRMLVTGTAAELKRSIGAGTVVQLHLDQPDAALGPLRALPEVREAERSGQGVRVLVTGREGFLPALVAATSSHGLRDLSVAEPTLETVFIKLTGRDLRD
jgi:ABC-2 type transport system ATP-binding protein